MNYRVPIAQPNIGAKEKRALRQVMRSGWISSQGPVVGEFEKAFMTRFGFTNGLAVSNGTVAIALALRVLGIRPGDEVLVPDITFGATANAVVEVGAKPVFVDVDAQTGLIDFEKAKRLVSPNTKAVVPVHLYGQLVDVGDLRRFEAELGLHVVEDCAEALGSSFEGRFAGSFGHAGTFSFFANKTITTGEGGFVTFRHGEDVARARLLRDHGLDRSKFAFHHLVAGGNYRMTAMQAAIGLTQVRRFDELFSKKLLIAETYQKLLGDIAAVRFLPERPGYVNGNWLTAVGFDSRERAIALCENLLREGIETRFSFPPLRHMPAYQLWAPPGAVDEEWSSDCFAAGLLCLPSSTNLSARQVRLVAERVRHHLAVLGCLRE